MSTILCSDAVEEVVEEGGTVGLVVVSGVVALADEDGHELGNILIMRLDVDADFEVNPGDWSPGLSGLLCNRA